MSTADSGSAGRDGEHIEERMALVGRISASPQFRRAAKLREFLAYVVEQTTKGQSDTLSEQQIGQAVFGRSADYSPSEDNVVRAHARQLRVKLAEYFADSGKNESLILEIPKGSYVPVFTVRESSPPEPVPPRRERWLARLASPPALWTTAIILVALLVTVVLLFVQNRSLKRDVDTLVAASGGAVPAPLAWVLDPDRTVSVVVADSCFGLVQDFVGRPASLEQYLTPQYWDGVRASPNLPKDAERLVRRASSRVLTSYADLLLATRILRLAGPRARVSFRFARDIRPRDLNSGNFIFLGSSYANPWVALYDRKRNFRIQIDASAHQSIANRSPRPGELPNYAVYGEDGAPGATYGLVSFFPSDGTGGNVLIIEGTNMEGTEAAGSLILDPKSAHGIFSRAGIAENSRSHPFFEVLIETNVLAGEPSQSRVVAWRN